MALLANQIEAKSVPVYMIYHHDSQLRAPSRKLILVVYGSEK